jgi:hypothetical protein
MTISSKFCSYWANGFRQEDFYGNFPYGAMLNMGNSHKNPLVRNHWVNSNQTLVEWSLDSPLPNLCPVNPTFNQDGRQARNRKKGPNRWTHFWKRTIQWLFHQNLVLIEQMVSDKKIFMGISHRVLCWIKFGCGGHLGRRSEMPDTILEEDHPRIISAKFGAVRPFDQNGPHSRT